MDWLEVQLEEFRERGMQVWLTGHVPPHSGHYFDNCCKLSIVAEHPGDQLNVRSSVWRPLSPLPRHYRWTSLWSHVSYSDSHALLILINRNVDHFFFLDVLDLEATAQSEVKSDAGNGTLVSAFAGPHLRHGPHLPNVGRPRTMGRGANNDLGDTLKKDFGEMPGPQKMKHKDYVVVNVHTSVIPTYLPGLRVYS